MKHQLTLEDLKDFSVTKELASSSEEKKRLEFVFSFHKGHVFYHVVKNGQSSGHYFRLKDAIKRYNEL